MTADQEHAAIFREMLERLTFKGESLPVKAAIERAIELLDPPQPALRSIDDLLSPDERKALSADLAAIAKQRRKGEAEARNVVLP